MNHIGGLRADLSENEDRLGIRAGIMRFISSNGSNNSNTSISVRNINHSLLQDNQDEESKSDTTSHNSNLPIQNQRRLSMGLDFRSESDMPHMPLRDNIEERMRLLRRNFENYDSSMSESSDPSIEPLSTCSKINEEKIKYNKIPIEDVKSILECTICFGQMTEKNHSMCASCSKTWCKRCITRSLKNDKR